MPGSKTAPHEAKPATRSTWYTTTASLAASRVGPAFWNGELGTDLAPLVATGAAREFEVASEAIAVIDIVQSTVSTNLYDWHSVGRVVTSDLRRLAREVCTPLGLVNAKTGTGGETAESEPTESRVLA